MNPPKEKKQELPATVRAELLSQLWGDLSHPDMMWITSASLVREDQTLLAILDSKKQAQIAAIRAQELEK